MSIFGKDDASEKMQNAIEESKKRIAQDRETHALKSAEIQAEGEANIAAIRQATDQRLAEMGNAHNAEVQEMFNARVTNLNEQLKANEITQDRYDRQLKAVKRIFKIGD